MNKRNVYLIIGLFLLLCCPLHSWSKITIKYEYWIDNNMVSTVTGEADDGKGQNLQIDVGDLSPGVHFYNVRAKYGNTGKWSTVYRTLFTIPFQAVDGEDVNLQQYEYWIDNAYEERVVTPCTDGDTPLLAVDVSSLTAGVHFFNVRAQHEDGVWGTISRTLFSIPATAEEGAEVNLQQYEYWIDDDYANRITTACTDGDTPLLSIDVSSLTAGVHFFNVRAQHDDGIWGDVERKLFSIVYPVQEAADKSITGYRYAFQSDDYAYSTVSKSVAPTDELVMNENITVALPETAPTVDDNCKFTFNTAFSEATMTRSVKVKFWVGFHAADGMMGVPVFYDDVTYSTDETFEWIEMEVGERSDDLPPQDEAPLSIVQFAIDEEMTYMVSSNTKCSLRLYKPDGKLLGQSDGQTLIDGWRCDLSKGTYYAVVFGNDEEVSLLVDEFHIPVITFADEYLEEYIITQTGWDKNDDGELDEEEAAQVTDLGVIFKQNTNITSFNELKYFTGLTSIVADAFRECTNLQSITLPASIVSIGSNAFRNCSALTSINIPASVTEIAENAYCQCSALTTITVDGGNKVFDSRKDCNAIIVSESASLLLGCQSTLIPEDVKALGQYAFYGCTGLTKVTIPASVVSIGNNTFQGCNNLTKVEVKNETPIVLGTNSIPKSIRQQATLYVPLDCKAAYVAADKWMDFKEIIEKPPFIKGDVDDDEEVTAQDASLILQYVAKKMTFTADQIAAGDVNGDGVITAQDAALILQYVAGKIQDW